MAINVCTLLYQYVSKYCDIFMLLRNVFCSLPFTCPHKHSTRCWTTKESQHHVNAACNGGTYLSRFKNARKAQKHVCAFTCATLTEELLPVSGMQSSASQGEVQFSLNSDKPRSPQKCSCIEMLHFFSPSISRVTSFKRIYSFYLC